MNLLARDSMKGKHILLLGAGIMQIPAILLAKRLGMEVSVFDGASNAVGASLADNFFLVNFSQEQEALSNATSLHQQKPLHAVFTVGTDFSTVVALIARKLDLPGIPYEAAKKAKNKYLMRQCLSEANIPVPEFIAGTADDLIKNYTQLQFPLVIKPTESMGARGVQLFYSESDLLTFLGSVIPIQARDEWILEEQIIGQEFSIDGLIVDGKLYPKGIARRFIDYTPYFIERGHSFPSELNETEELSICSLVEKCAEVYDIRNGMVKGDIFLTNDGPVIGELAARLSGGFMSGWSYPLYAQESAIEQGILLALGQYEMVKKFQGKTAIRSKAVCERAMISIPGIIKERIELTKQKLSTQGLTSMEELDYENLASRFIYVAKENGQSVEFPKNNVEKAGNIITWDTSLDEAKLHTENLIAKQLILLEPNTNQTEANLSQIHHAAYPNNFKRLIHKEKDQELSLELDLNWSFTEKDWNFRSLRNSLNFYHAQYSISATCTLFQEILKARSIETVLENKKSKSPLWIFLFFHFIGGLQLSIYVKETLSRLDKDEQARRLEFWLIELLALSKAYF
jgi:biotin carboxylase